jgi:hypothetical protein
MEVLAKASFEYFRECRSPEGTISAWRGCLSPFCQSKKDEFRSHQKYERPLAAKLRIIYGKTDFEREKR